MLIGFKKRVKYKFKDLLNNTLIEQGQFVCIKSNEERPPNYSQTRATETARKRSRAYIKSPNDLLMKTSISAAVLLPVVVYMITGFAFIGNYCKTSLSKSIPHHTAVYNYPKQTYAYPIDFNCMVLIKSTPLPYKRTIPTPLRFACSMNLN